VSKKRGNGEGSITKRKDGRWEARYTIHTSAGPKRRTLYGRMHHFAVIPAPFPLIPARPAGFEPATGGLEVRCSVP
jgi:hypothetical protein